LNKYHLTSTQINEEWLLIKRCKLDNKHFAIIYERYFKQIFLYIFKKTGDENSTADITSQVFLTALNQLERYEFKGFPYSSFLYKVAHNECLMYFRQTKKKRMLSINDFEIEKIAEELPDLENKDKIDLILKGISHLKVEDIQFIELRFFEGLSFKEVGEILGISEGTAKTRTYRILDKIKNYL
jgi:RNA polymerase sigma-70 factor, ECF subfamily